MTPCVNVAVRTSDMYNVCRELNELASVDGVAVVCVNQVYLHGMWCMVEM